MRPGQLRRVNAEHLNLADILHNGPAAPIKVDLSQWGLLGSFYGGRVWRFEELIGLRVGVDVAGFGVDLGELIEVRRLYNHVPAKWIPRIWLSGDAVDGNGSDGIAEDQSFGLGMLRIAQAPDEEHSDEGEDGPVAAAEGYAPGTDFAIGESEKSGNHERGNQQ